MNITQRRPRGERIRHAFSVLLTLAACGLMIVSGYLFRPGTRLEGLGSAAATFLLGGLALGLALWLSKNRQAALKPAEIPLSPTRTRWRMVGLGVIVLALIAEISGQALKIPMLKNVQIHLQFALWALGLLLVGWGFAGGIRLRFSIKDRRTALLLGVIVLIGLAARTWGLDTTARFLQDEGVFIDGLRFFWKGNSPYLLNGGGAFTITLVYPYWNAWTIDLLGRNLVGLRMASALLGVCAIPVAYELTRVLLDKRAGLIAALLVATFPPHIQFSRISWGHTGDALFGLMALMFIARAIKENRRADWAFAGVCLGLTQYFYEVGRLLYPPLVIGWFVLLMLAWRRMKRYRRGFLITVLAALLVAAPVYYFIAVRHLPAAPRTSSSATSLDYWKKFLDGKMNDDERRGLIQRVTTPFLIYIQHADDSTEYYGGYEALVVPLLVPLFLLGVFWVIWRIRYPVGILLITLLFGSFANIFAADPGFSPRYVAFSPMIPMLMAVGLDGVLRLLSISRRWLVTTLATAAAAWQIYFFFGVHLPYYNVQRRRVIPERDIFDAVLRTTDLPVNTEVFLIDPAPKIDYGRAIRLYQFLADHPYPLQDPTRENFDPSALPPNRDYAFFIAPGDTQSLDKIRLAFPNVRPPLYTPYPIPTWDEYVLLLTYAREHHLP